MSTVVEGTTSEDTPGEDVVVGSRGLVKTGESVSAVVVPPPGTEDTGDGRSKEVEVDALIGQPGETDHLSTSVPKDGSWTDGRSDVTYRTLTFYTRTKVLEDLQGCLPFWMSPFLGARRGDAEKYDPST